MKKTTRQTSSRLLTSVSASLGSSRWHLRRSWLEIRSWIRPWWSPTCPSFTSSFVARLFLPQVVYFLIPLLYHTRFHSTVYLQCILFDSTVLFSSLLDTIALLYFCWLSSPGLTHCLVLFVVHGPHLFHCVTEVCRGNSKKKMQNIKWNRRFWISCGFLFGLTKWAVLIFTGMRGMRVCIRAVGCLRFLTVQCFCLHFIPHQCDVVFCHLC